MEEWNLSRSLSLSLSISLSLSLSLPGFIIMPECSIKSFQLQKAFDI